MIFGIKLNLAKRLIKSPLFINVLFAFLVLVGSSMIYNNRIGAIAHERLDMKNPTKINIFLLLLSTWIVALILERSSINVATLNDIF